MTAAVRRDTEPSSRIGL